MAPGAVRCEAPKHDSKDKYSVFTAVRNVWIGNKMTYSW